MKVTYCMADKYGSAYQRMFIPYGWASNIPDWETEITTFEETQNFDSDIVILQRQRSSRLIEVIEQGQKRGIKFVYEIDDDLTNIPKNNKGYEHWNKNNNVQNSLNIAKACDAVTVSTTPLQEVFKKFNANVFILPNFINEPEVSFQEKQDSTVRIGWAGSDSHSVDFDTAIVHALRDIKARYKDRVQLIFVGWMPKLFQGNAYFFKAVPPTDYLTYLRYLNLDIGVIPCIKHPFNHSKSNLKHLEYSINKIVTVASPVYPYLENIQDTVNGFICRKNRYKGWYNVLERLIEGEGERLHVSETAYNDVSSHYLWKNNLSLLKSTYEQILDV